MKKKELRKLINELSDIVNYDLEVITEKLYGQPVFVLKADDRFTKILVQSWIKRANAVQDSDLGRTREALVTLNRIQHWQHDNPSRVK